MVQQHLGGRHVREDASESPKKLSSPCSRHSKHTQQAQLWDEFGGEQAKKKKREPRKIEWSSCGFLNNLRPEDPTLFETVLRELEEQDRAISSPSSGINPYRPSSVASTPETRLTQATAASPGSPSPRKMLQRPQSAPNISSSPRGTSKRPSSSSRPQRHRLTRPQSAPRLLDGSGLLEKRPHRSSFLQRVEDLAVRGTIEKFKSEKAGGKAASANVNIMADTSLFDLRVLHNPTARARTAKIRRDSPPRDSPLSPTKGQGARGTAAAVHRIGPRHPKWRELPAADQMRNLCHVLDMDLRLHAPAPREATLSPPCYADAEIESSPQEAQPQAVERSTTLLSNFSDAVNFSDLRSKKRLRTSQFVANQSPEMLRITVNLLEFLLEKCSNLSEFVRVLNISRQGVHGQSSRRDDKSCKVTRREWETALMALGYVSDDPSRLFRALDTENAGELMCEDIVDVLEAHCPHLIQRRLKPASPISKRDRDRRQSLNSGWSSPKEEFQVHLPVIGFSDASPIPSESEASESYQAL